MSSPDLFASWQSNSYARKQRRCLEYELTDRDWRSAQARLSKAEASGCEERIENLESQKREVAEQMHKAST